MNHIFMEEFMEERVLELKAEILKALAQPTRLKILELLREMARNVSVKLSRPLMENNPISPGISP